VITIVLGIVLKGQNVAFLVGLAFVIAPSANIPALICTLFWKKSTKNGIIAGIITGLVVSVGLILVSPTVMGTSALFPLENPGIVSIPFGFLVTILVSLAVRDKGNDFDEKSVTS